MPSVASISVFGAVVACVVAFGLVGGLMLIGWRQRPMLEIPPRRFEGELPDVVRKLPSNERKRIAQLARSGRAVVDDQTDAPLVEAYCRWGILQTDRFSLSRMARWRQALWVGTIGVYVAGLVAVLESRVPWLGLIFVPMLLFRVSLVTGLLPRLASRKYRRTAEVNGWSGTKSAAPP